MKIDIYYFSGTGNTAWVVRHLAEHLTEMGDEVVVASCENLSIADVDPLEIQAGMRCGRCGPRDTSRF
jgi:flavodoxin